MTPTDYSFAAFTVICGFALVRFFWIRGFKGLPALLMGGLLIWLAPIGVGLMTGSLLVSAATIGIDIDGESPWVAPAGYLLAIPVLLGLLILWGKSPLSPPLVSPDSQVSPNDDMK